MSLVAFLYLYVRSTWSSHFFDQYMAYLIWPDTRTFEFQQRTCMVGHVRTSHIFQSLLPANMDILILDLPCLYTDHITWSINSIFCSRTSFHMCMCHTTLIVQHTSLLSSHTGSVSQLDSDLSAQSLSTQIH